MNKMQRLESENQKKLVHTLITKSILLTIHRNMIIQSSQMIGDHDRGLLHHQLTFAIFFNMNNFLHETNIAMTASVIRMCNAVDTQTKYMCALRTIAASLKVWLFELFRKEWMMWNTNWIHSHISHSTLYACSTPLVAHILFEQHVYFFLCCASINMCKLKMFAVRFWPQIT